MSNVSETVIKKDSKIFVGEDAYPLDSDMTIEDILEIIKEDNPAYSNATNDNCYVNDNGDLVVSQPKSKTNG